jgi:hypothetical protein
MCRVRAQRARHPQHSAAALPSSKPPAEASLHGLQKGRARAQQLPLSPAAAAAAHDRGRQQRPTPKPVQRTHLRF